MFNMGLNKQCFIGLHHYEVYKELEVKDSNYTNDTTVGINIISRCTNCGKIKIEFVATDANYLVDSRGVRTGK